MKRSILRPISSVSALALVVLAWWLLAPPQLGGRTSYAVIYGVSMQPHFYHGDLVLLRSDSSYHVGEVVGYHSEKLGKPVLHRIIKIQNGHYWFKGDNNDFVDPEHPVASQLFGREWLRLPGVGSRLEQLHEPRNAAILAGAAALFVLAGGGVRARRRRRRRSGDAPGLVLGRTADVRPTTTEARPTASPPRASWLLSGSATIAAVGLSGVAAMSILALVAFTRPPQVVSTQSDLYTQRGTFDYSAQAPVGPVYDSSPVGPPNALFVRLVHKVAVSFRYGMTATTVERLSGTSSMDAYLTDRNGWRRNLSLQPVQTYTGSHVTLRGTLDLDALLRMISRFEAATGSQLSSLSPYQVVLRPHVSVRGTVGTQRVDEKFDPTLTFELTQGRLRLARTSDGVSDNTLTRSSSGTGTTSSPQKLGLGLPVGVSAARHVALIGLPASIAVALLGGLLFLLVRGNDEVALIRRRYGAWMVDVAAAQRPAHIERRVESMDALARIAERYERLILHEQRDREHSFLVEDDGIVYRYDAQEKQSWRLDRSHGPEEHAEAGSAPAAATDVREE